MSETAPAGRQQERTERSTAALLDAAAQLIVEGGYSALTFAAIGERAGFSRGLVTARFDNKDGLIEALIDRVVAAWSIDAMRREDSDRTGREVLRQAVENLLQRAIDDPEGLRALNALMFVAAGDEALRPRFADFHQRSRDAVAAMIVRGQEDGSVRPGLDPDVEAVMLVGAMRGIGDQWQLDPEGFDAIRAFEHLAYLTDLRLSGHEETS